MLKNNEKTTRKNKFDNKPIITPDISTQRVQNNQLTSNQFDEMY